MPHKIPIFTRLLCGKHRYGTETCSDQLCLLTPLLFCLPADNIREDMVKCREAIQRGKWAELAAVVHRIAAKARRVIDVARTQVDSVPARQKKSLEAAVERTERGTLTVHLEGLRTYTVF